MLSHFIICSYFAVFIAPDFFHIFFQTSYTLYYRVFQKKHHLLVSVFPGTVCMLIKLEIFFTGIAMVLILILCGTSKKIYFRLDKTMKPLVPKLKFLGESTEKRREINYLFSRRMWEGVRSYSWLFTYILGLCFFVSVLKLKLNFNPIRILHFVFSSIWWREIWLSHKV